jgi:hypothetical protein
MSGILAVYALVISVLIASDIRPPPTKNYSLYAGFMHMAAGLSVGLSGMAAGYAIGIVGDVVGTGVWLEGHTLTVTGCPRIHATVEDLCRHGSHSDFRRSAGTVRVSGQLLLPRFALTIADSLWLSFSTLEPAVRQGGVVVLVRICAKEAGTSMRITELGLLQGLYTIAAGKAAWENDAVPRVITAGTFGARTSRRRSSSSSSKPGSTFTRSA